MKKQFNEKSYFDTALKQLDKDIIWNQERKSKLQNQLLSNIDKFKYKPKILTRFKYASSVGIFIVALLVGYNLLSENITYNNGEESTGLPDNQTENDFIIDDLEDKEKVSENDDNEFARTRRLKVTKEELLQDVNLRLPQYIPNQVKTTPQYIKHEHPNGMDSAKVNYVESQNFFISLAQEEINQDEETVIQKVKKVMYKNEKIEELKIDGYPSFFHKEGDTSYYSSLHIITDKYFITLTTHGIEKGELIKMANSIDLTGL